ncbi:MULTISPECIES: metal ABC transporter substrate-binding protein [unclassified Thioalkalivibrio]|uniref:metal ABC transporter substrate-binding protein n=1 Tax=unclassified Thioalkalivibrio TaxID=2621013 RepID=UPI0003640EF9|nr:MULTISPECIES: metal ABC transporter substrate-binding protein [unclassified Thioalkalivibrio]PYG03424.1 zinc/manganese transport system substrate-binding protein [Thioalkalivibrio sp. ALE21]
MKNRKTPQQRPAIGLSALTGAALATALFLPAQASADELNVVATTSSLGALAREIGGDETSVRVLAAPDRDAHYLDARPSFMAALRNADLLLELGAGLEEGWLPAATRGASNPAINEGQRGHFYAAGKVDLRRSITQDGPNMGHVHEEGNPHFNVDPLRMAEVGLALGERLAELDSANADVYRERAEETAQRLREHAEHLASELAPDQNIVVYHEDLDYLEEWLPATVVGYLEPAPGIPPTGRHLQSLVGELEDMDGHVLYAEFQPPRGAEFLERELGWDSHAVPLDPPQDAGLDGYLELMETWASTFRTR